MNTQIEVGDRLWFGHFDDGWRAVVTEHLRLTQKSKEDIMQVLKKNGEWTKGLRFDSLVFLKTVKEGTR